MGEMNATQSIVEWLQLPAIVLPIDQHDPHTNVTHTREYNWHRDARGLLWPHLTIPFAMAALLYYPTMRMGIQQMSARKPFDLRVPLCAWNVLLSALSAIGAYYVLGHLRHELNTRELTAVVCDHRSAYTSGAAMFVALFNFSKIFEWGDTIFLILRKKNVIFLHWFHHLLTFIYCWHATLFSYRADATGFWFAGMNLFVHAIMYGYYAFSAAGVQIPFSFLITILQTAQMVVGVAVLAMTPQCEDSWRENWHGNCIAAFMYLVYLWLFAQLLLKKVSQLFAGRKAPKQKPQ